MIPAPARRTFEQGVLCYLAVRTPDGPHLTPVVFALDGSRLWVTTARTSVKARALRAGSSVAGLVRSGDVVACFRGRAKLYDALDPFTWPSITFSAPRLMRAAMRFSLKNARFFAGYAVDAPRVPLAWSPPGRVFVGIEPKAGAVLREDGSTAPSGWDDWTSPAPRYRSSYAQAKAKGAIDLRVPQPVRATIGSSGRGAVGFDSGTAGLSVLPASWVRVAREGAYVALVPVALLERAAPAPGSPIALTVDRAAAWRAADMAGMLLQGQADLFAPRATRRGKPELSGLIERTLEKLGRDPRRAHEFALIRLRPSRVVWWQGWTSGTVTAR
jgi:hypothetical protein